MAKTYDEKRGEMSADLSLGGAISSTNQSRPHEAYPELVSALRMLKMHDPNPIWWNGLLKEIDAALATERNTSYKRGWDDQRDVVSACLA